jgi:arylformamidase
MKRALNGAAILATLVGGTALAQRERLSGECRRAVVQLCSLSGGREGIRSCLRDRASGLPERCRTEILGLAAQRAASRVELPPNATELIFGRDAKQRLDYWAPASGARRPLVVFVHGGGWAIGDKRSGLGEKATHFTAGGYAFASVNYRLVPQVTPEDQAADVASALALLRRQPGVDPDRIVLIGHSAGAHLVALVGTDPRYLRSAGVPIAAVRGIVPLDGAGYDVVKQMADKGNRVSGMYAAAFSTDPARQAALSPIRHAAAPNVANWLIVNDADRPDSQAQSDALAAALRAAGNRAERLPISNTSHMLVNRNLGKPGDAQTAQVDGFIAAVTR